MRGEDPQQAAIFSAISSGERVPPAHPWRVFRAMVDAVLKKLSPQFARRDSFTGRPAIAPEKWLRARLRQVLYTVRREWLLMEQRHDTFLLRWCVGWNMDDPSWDSSTFSKNRARLFEGAVAHAFFAQVLAQARDLRSDEHCTVDGTLIEAWAGQKRFKRKEAARASPPDDPGHPGIDCRGERRTNATQVSTTDAEARLYTQAKAKRRSWPIGGMS